MTEVANEDGLNEEVGQMGPPRARLLSAGEDTQSDDEASEVASLPDMENIVCSHSSNRRPKTNLPLFSQQISDADEKAFEKFMSGNARSSKTLASMIQEKMDDKLEEITSQCSDSRSRFLIHLLENVVKNSAF
jgi:hypothetical protein